jgi:hypothetical protein
MEECQVIYKGKNIRIISDLSAETLKARKTWNDIIQALRTKLSPKINGKMTNFQDKHKLK